MADETVYDVVVLGAGVAGAAAGLRSRTRGLRTVIVDRGRARGNAHRVEWLHPQAAETLKSAGVSTADAIVGAIDRVRLIDEGARRQTTAAIGRNVPLVNSGELAAAILDKALADGAELRRSEVLGVELQERSVSLRTADDPQIRGKLLLAADGYPSLAAKGTAADRTVGAARGGLCCHAHRRLHKTQNDKNGELTIFFESTDLSRFGLGFTTEASEALDFVAPSDASEIKAEFELAVQRWITADLLAGKWKDAPLQSEVRSLPRGAALDAETHVGKNTLAVGDAGGYVSAVSNEGLHGAICSAFIAADTCADALQSAHPQDVLMEFDARWRAELVEYLRPPNSDMRFLLPLVFSNKRMAERVAQAFILGVNI